jgi:hypothetical protein
MNGNEEIEADALRRIVAVLFALADVAERASGRSYPIRCFVLWLLRHAEVVARDWMAAGDAGDLPHAPSAHEHPVPISVLHRNGPADAIYLAQAFRALARELRRRLRLEGQLARRLMRRETAQAPVNAPQGGLFASDRMVRLARATLVALIEMDNAPNARVARLDTS